MLLLPSEAGAPESRLHWAAGTEGSLPLQLLESDITRLMLLVFLLITLSPLV